MARLIDADKLLTNVVSVSNSKGQVTWSAVSTMDILTAPTVDAVEVVRCRDCKYYVKFESSLIGEVMCCTGQGSVNIQKQPDDFCSYGERKEGDGNG